jgi:Na+/H+ antiporter NhaD/arsenite permease-like protein
VAHFLSDTQLIIAYVIFFASYLVFAIGRFPGTKIDRTAAAIIGAAMMFAFRITDAETGMRSIDFATLVLLFSMMLITADLHVAGFFDWVTSVCVEHVQPRFLLPSVIFTSGILSAFLVNDIICLLMAPLILRVCRQMSLPATPYLLALATASNIGSTATITGNPQNILIGSLSAIPYRTFLLHLGPVALIGLFLDWLVLHLIYFRSSNKVTTAVQTPSQPEWIEPLAVKKSRLIFPVAITVLVLIGFLAGAPPALTAALGAAILLIHPAFHPRQIYGEVDSSLLVFFVGLFLITGAVEQIGIAQQMLMMAEHLNLHKLWIFSAVTVGFSNIVSNVPAVMLLKDLAPQYNNSQLFWLLLAMSSTLAGNLTITGSVANIIVVEKVRSEHPIGFREYMRAGVPITLLTVIVGIIWLKISS